MFYVFSTPCELTFRYWSWVSTRLRIGRCLGRRHLGSLVLGCGGRNRSVPVDRGGRLFLQRPARLLSFRIFREVHGVRSTTPEWTARSFCGFEVMEA